MNNPKGVGKCCLIVVNCILKLSKVLMSWLLGSRLDLDLAAWRLGGLA